MHPTENQLVWWPELGYGFRAPDTAFPYDDNYFAKKQAREATEVGKLLVQRRCIFLERSGCGSKAVVDVGIGAGTFVKAFECYGYDVNPRAIELLKTLGRWHDLSREPFAVACFWDSLEHMMSPEAILKNVRNEAFISIPIHENGEAAARSKHFRPNEHLWHFTEWGLIEWMAKQGFELYERNRDEERYGRESIGSYRFGRKR